MDERAQVDQGKRLKMGEQIPELRTLRLLLRPFALVDAPVVQRLAGDPEVALTTQDIPYPYEEGMAEEWISSHRGLWEAQELLSLALTTEAEGLVGAVSLAFNLPNRRGELGYRVGRPFWNRGYAPEASEAIVHFGFSEMNLNRIQARYMVRNPASGRVMEKLGMKFEGILRELSLNRGRFEDMVNCLILASDR
jgi:RimJ/RimL family protein N-acetyltransferase